MTSPMPPRLYNLDILRLVSALLVLAFHYGFRMQMSGEGGGTGFPELAPYAIWMDTGLLIFFTISGYVITMSSDGRSALDFGVGRIARLWPTFMLCAGITAIVIYFWPVPGTPSPTFRQWLAHVVIISRALGQPFLDGAYWTIAYEVIFYTWAFVLIACGWFRTYWRTIAVVWLLISLGNEAGLQSEALRKVFVTEYSGYFVFGLVLYRLRQQVELGAVIVLIAATAWAVATPFIIEAKFHAAYGIHRDAIGLALMALVALASVTVCVIAPPLPLRPALATGLGALTYPLYLLHQNIGYAVFARFAEAHGRWLVAAVLVSALLLASWVIARFFEIPTRRFIQQIPQALRNLRPGVAGHQRPVSG